MSVVVAPFGRESPADDIEVRRPESSIADQTDGVDLRPRAMDAITRAKWRAG